MSAFRYQAIEPNGNSVEGVIEAEDRKAALHLLGSRGLFPENLEVSAGNGEAAAAAAVEPEGAAPASRRAKRITRKDITAFTREMSALLSATIPIPQALEGLGEQEENPTLQAVILKVSDSVRRGASLSYALDEHPKLFSKLYVSMVRVGEEAGALPKVMTDLANLLEHEDEVRGEVLGRSATPFS